MSNWKVIYYISPRGENPVEDFLDTKPTAKLKALRIFAHIKEYGLTTAIPHIKKLSGTPLWEIRILGGDSIRILYATLSGQRIILLNAFVKKTQKTPPKEIKLALSRFNELT